MTNNKIGGKGRAPPVGKRAPGCRTCYSSLAETLVHDAGMRLDHNPG
jgi:hypothetical protein